SSQPVFASPTPPDAAHPGSLALLGGGSRSGAAFASLTVRGVLHDLVSSAVGQMPDQQLELLRIELRLPLRSRLPSLWELRLLRMEAAARWDPTDRVRPSLWAEQDFNLGARWQIRGSASWTRDDWTVQSGFGAYF